jgi:hypothetical protein
VRASRHQPPLRRLLLHEPARHRALGISGSRVPAVQLQAVERREAVAPVVALAPV